MLLVDPLVAELVGEIAKDRNATTRVLSSM
jgi:hypothetical protein